MDKLEWLQAFAEPEQPETGAAAPTPEQQERLAALSPEGTQALTQEQREALCRLLEIPADAPQPTPLHRRILAAVALAAFVTILVMAVYPIYKSRHAGANPEAAQETPVPQSEKYSWDWFQQPDAQPVEGQANIELTTAERPLMLTESENEEKPYVWSILLVAQETNGVSFTMEKVTEVYFNNEKLPMQTTEMTANEIEWYWYTTRLEAGGMTSYATDRPADGGIGYGVAVEGKDDNGNELTFKLYSLSYTGIEQKAGA